tara:strand:- start:619 stop:2724 length:2106 start_codon:yes stop_codon:yes gene_type:complete
MTRRTRAEIKTFFQNGDAPNESQFADLIDSSPNISDDGGVANGLALLDSSGLVPLVNVPPGSKGETGNDGPQGAQGVVGNTGLQGIQGLSGLKGDIGFQGETGPQGNVGANGSSGLDGSQGESGADGSNGANSVVAGPQGAQGIQGITGSQGPAGENGFTGGQGLAGAQGSQGNAGADSTVQGPTGSTGSQGIQGETGPQGIQGPAGADGSGGGGGVDTITAEEAALISATAAGSTLGLQQSLLANAGQPALTVLAVGQTNTGKVQGNSLGDGNVIEVYANGADFNAGTVLYREFMSLGEVICFTGLSNGAIITSTQGFYGFCENVSGNNESPMPLLSYGLSFTFTFLFAFRNSSSYSATIGPVNNAGRVNVVNGPLKSIVKFTDGGGVTVRGQENIELAPWEFLQLNTDGDKEYIISSTNPVMAGVYADDGLYDMRLVMPLTNDGITWPRSGFVSAPYNNTVVNYFVRDNAQGSFTVSPGSAIDFDSGSGTGADDSDYESDGATRVLVNGLISAYSGADSAGLEASPLMPTSAMSQVVAQPLFISDSGDGGNSSVSISSPYVGTAKVYSWNDSTKTIDLEYTVPLTRNGVTVTNKEDQKHPAAGQVANEGSASNQLVGELKPGVVIADVPITVVVQGDTRLLRTIRSQNGATTDSILEEDDETLSLGWTPASLKAEITEGADGILYRRVINAGASSWVVA